jgi:hypothetical protein
MTQLAFAEAGFPIIPVRLYRERDRWRKQPMAKWDQATTNEATIAGWLRLWPDALPGIPLARMNWVVVDADRRDGIDGVAQVTDLGPLGPHSRIATPSGGLHLVFAQPPVPIHGRFNWCEGVEVLGEGCLLTCYDLDELKFPHVAPRAILPKMFWQPRDDVGIKRSPIKNSRVIARADAVYVADVTAALREMKGGPNLKEDDLALIDGLRDELSPEEIVGWKQQAADDWDRVNVVAPPIQPEAQPAPPKPSRLYDANGRRLLRLVIPLYNSLNSAPLVKLSQGLFVPETLGPDLRPPTPQ